MLHLNVMKVQTPDEMGKAAADEFEAVIKRKPACVLGLAPARHRCLSTVN